MPGIVFSGDQSQGKEPCREMNKIILKMLSFLENISAVAANVEHFGNKEYSQYRTWDLLKAHQISTFIPHGGSVLDIGCGNGHRLHELGMFRKDLKKAGVDIHNNDGLPKDVFFDLFDGKTLEFHGNSFDVSMICYVLHYLTPDHAMALLNEASRISKTAIVVLEDSMDEFSARYKMRNFIHRVYSDVLYGGEGSYVPARNQKMFHTHGQWKGFLLEVDGAKNVAVMPLARISRFAHHTLFHVQLS